MELVGLFRTDGERVALAASSCPRCNAVAFPPRRVCGECGARDLLFRWIDGSGKVIASTRLETPPAGFDGPLLVGLVDLDAGPRVFAILAGDVKTGARVGPRPAPVRDGNPGFRFEAAG